MEGAVVLSANQNHLLLIRTRLLLKPFYFAVAHVKAFSCVSLDVPVAFLSKWANYLNIFRNIDDDFPFRHKCSINERKIIHSKIRSVSDWPWWPPTLFFWMATFDPLKGSVICSLMEIFRCKYTVWLAVGCCSCGVIVEQCDSLWHDVFGLPSWKQTVLDICESFNTWGSVRNWTLSTLLSSAMETPPLWTLKSVWHTRLDLTCLIYEPEAEKNISVHKERNSNSLSPSTSTNLILIFFQQ